MWLPKYWFFPICHCDPNLSFYLAAVRAPLPMLQSPVTASSWEVRYDPLYFMATFDIICHFARSSHYKLWSFWGCLRVTRDIFCLFNLDTVVDIFPAQSMWPCTPTSLRSRMIWPSGKETSSWSARRMASGGTAPSGTARASSPATTSNPKRPMWETSKYN